MNISSMTLDEVRDKLAELRGWEKHRATGSTKEDGEDGLYWKRKGRMTWDHPIPNTLDEAAKLPEGWEWNIERDYEASCAETAWQVWAAYAPESLKPVTVPRTADEKDDRFRLQLACELAEKEGR